MKPKKGKICARVACRGPIESSRPNSNYCRRCDQMQKSRRGLRPRPITPETRSGEKADLLVVAVNLGIYLHVAGYRRGGSPEDHVARSAASSGLWLSREHPEMPLKDKCCLIEAAIRAVLSK